MPVLPSFVLVLNEKPNKLCYVDFATPPFLIWIFFQWLTYATFPHDLRCALPLARMGNACQYPEPIGSLVRKVTMAMEYGGERAVQESMIPGAQVQ